MFFFHSWMFGVWCLTTVAEGFLLVEEGTFITDSSGRAWRSHSKVSQPDLMASAKCSRGALAPVVSLAL